MSTGRARFTRVATMVGSNRRNGGGRTDHEIVAEAGYRDLGDFWGDVLSRRMAVRTFARLLEDHLTDAARTADEIDGRRLPLMLEIESELRRALKSGEPWFSHDPLSPSRSGKDDIGNWALDPRPAAEWLRASRLTSELVPTSLATFLEFGETAADPVVTEVRPPGRPSLMDQILLEMLERNRRGELCTQSKAAEWRALHAWCRAKFPRQEAPTAKAIGNRLSAEYDELRRRARNSARK